MAPFRAKLPGDSLIFNSYEADADVIFCTGDNRRFLVTLPEESVDLVVTSPPYNLGKKYERKTEMDRYLATQERVIEGCIKALKPNGSICWQVGNYVENGSIVPLDILLYPIFKSHHLVLRNRIVWTFGHGLHSRRRFSGRYETVLWFTRETDEYYFDLDAVRVPQKYPGKRHYKGPNAGQYSGHHLGKNPGDVWDIPNVKANHVEKTIHECQFPVALVQRLIRALCPEGGTVLDPYAGVGSTACAAIIERRRAIGCEKDAAYARLATKRIELALAGELAYRPLERPIYDPEPGSPLTVRLEEPPTDGSVSA